MNNLVLWIVDENHRAEQRASWQRVEELMPDIEKRVFLVMPTKSGHWYESYIMLLQEALSAHDAAGNLFDSFLFFDSDTYLCESVYDIFELLEKYDLVSTHAPARQTERMPAEIIIPDAYPELNTGVLGFRNTPQIHQLFDLWLQKYNEMYEVSGDNDQTALRVAMWEQGTHAYIMPEEYNCRYGFGGFAGSRVKILHGRSPNIQEVAEKINQEKSMRTWTRGSLI